MPMWDLWIYFSLLALNMVAWLTRFRHHSFVLHLLAGALLVTLLLEGYSAFLMFRQEKNLHIYQFLAPVQYALFAAILWLLIRGSAWRKAIACSIPLYALLALLIACQFQATEVFNSYTLALKHILLASWSLVYIREIFHYMPVDRLEREPSFWLVSGLLFHALGNFFNDGLMNTMLVESFDAAHTFYFIGIFLSFLLYLMTLVAFLLSGRQSSPACTRA